VEAEEPIVLALLKPLQHPTGKGLGGSTFFCCLSLKLEVDDWRDTFGEAPMC